MERIAAGRAMTGSREFLVHFGIEAAPAESRDGREARRPRPQHLRLSNARAAVFTGNCSRILQARRRLIHAQA